MIKRTTSVFAVGALLLLLAAAGPAEAAFPGANGRIAYDAAEYGHETPDWQPIP